MLSPRIAEGQQIPLIHEVHSDDEHLLNTLDGEWFEILYHFRWEDYRELAADYYNALYDFNQTPLLAATEESDASPETKEEARQRLLFDRATAPMPTNPPAPILFQAEVVERKAQDVQPCGCCARGGSSAPGRAQAKVFFWPAQELYRYQSDGVSRRAGAGPPAAQEQSGVCPGLWIFPQEERPRGLPLPAGPFAAETRTVRPDHDRCRYLGPDQARRRSEPTWPAV